MLPYFTYNNISQKYLTILMQKFLITSFNIKSDLDLNFNILGGTFALIRPIYSSLGKIKIYVKVIMNKIIFRLYYILFNIRLVTLYSVGLTALSHFCKT